MEPFIKHKGLVVPLNRANVDTDQIIPKQFLKRIERTGFGEFLFFDWRFKDDGTANDEFELNRAKYQGSTILLTGPNFGCGSSREHAPWALLDFGFKVLLASSFADIFYNNCFKNGILPVTLPEREMSELFQRTEQLKGYSLTIDLEDQQISDDHDLVLPFEIEAFRREYLLKGLDDIGLTLENEQAINLFESRRKTFA